MPLHRRRFSTMAKVLDDEQRWADLMRLAHTGDSQAYNVLLQELSSAITAYLRKRFGYMAFVDDCVQESLIAIHHARHTYQFGRPFKPWLFAIVKYKTIDALRKNQRIENQYVSELESDVDSNGDSMSSGYAVNDKVEQQLLTSQLLYLLPIHYGKAMVLTKLMGFSVCDTAKMLDISESAVKQHVRRAIVKTRALLEADAI